MIPYAEGNDADICDTDSPFGTQHLAHEKKKKEWRKS